ncbi:hypothetical protein O3G_MSEX000320 [Manduca sexta]|nr:hypothetical protein O3G_MSEX000320 [Manduca sexta]
MRLFLLPLILTLVAAEEVNYFMKVYEDCKRSEGLLPCLQKKAIVFFDRAARMEKIPLFEGVDVVKSSNVNTVPLSENEIDVVLPRNLEDKHAALTQMLWDRIATFANSRTVQLSLPKISGEELNKGVEEGMILKYFYY